MPALGIGLDGGVTFVVQGRGVCRLVLRVDYATLGHVILDQAAERGKGRRHCICLKLGRRWRVTHVPVGVRRRQQVQHLLERRGVAFAILLEGGTNCFEGGAESSAVIVLRRGLYICHDREDKLCRCGLEPERLHLGVLCLQNRSL